MANIISTCVNPGERVEGIIWGRRGTKQPAPPYTKLLAVLWLPAPCWVLPSLVVLDQKHSLAHSVTYTRLFRVG